MAISQIFEKLILQGKAQHKIWNISEAVNNINAGRGANFIVESIRVNPFSKINVFSGQPSAVSTWNQANIENTVFTLKVYDNDNIKSFSFKNSFDLNSLYRESTNVCFNNVQSRMNIEKSVFWLFQNSNLTAEISFANMEVIGQTLGSSNAVKSKRPNPSGFDGNVVQQKHYGAVAPFSNFKTNPLGRLSNLPPGDVQYDHFTIINQGSIGSPNYNGVQTPTTATNDINDSVLPLINLGIIEFSDEVKKELCES